MAESQMEFLKDALDGLVRYGLEQRLFTAEQLLRFGSTLPDALDLRGSNLAHLEAMANVRQSMISELGDLSKANTAFAHITAKIAKASIEKQRRIVDPATKNTRTFGGGALFGVSVRRAQFAVGHGGFHAGRLRLFQSKQGL